MEQIIIMYYPYGLQNGRSKHRRTPQDTAGHHRTAKDRHNIVIYEPHT